MRSLWREVGGGGNSDEDAFIRSNALNISSLYGTHDTSLLRRLLRRASRSIPPSVLFDPVSFENGGTLFGSRLGDVDRSGEEVRTQHGMLDRFSCCFRPHTARYHCCVNSGNPTPYLSFEPESALLCLPTLPRPTRGLADGGQVL